VKTWGVAWLVAGEFALLICGNLTGGLGLVLIFFVVLYDATHKRISFAPVLMAACRFMLYAVAASTGGGKVTGEAVWGALALALYIIGLSYLARRESTAGVYSYWPLLLLCSPIVLALTLNAGAFRENALLLAAIFALWTARCLRFTLRKTELNIGRTVAGLLAGIVLVDWLAVANLPRELSLLFIGFFILANAFQSFIPAT
jgi:4-hydroxybenzoate polyprenyltransferase